MDKTTQAAEATEPTEPTGGEPATGDATDTLGDAGKKALASERAARKAAEKRANDLAAQIKATEDEGKSEAQKQADALAVGAAAVLHRIFAQRDEVGVRAGEGLFVDGRRSGAGAEKLRVVAQPQPG